LGYYEDIRGDLAERFCLMICHDVARAGLSAAKQDLTGKVLGSACFWAKLYQ